MNPNARRSKALLEKTVARALENLPYGHKANFYDIGHAYHSGRLSHMEAERQARQVIANGWNRRSLQKFLSARGYSVNVTNMSDSQVETIARLVKRLAAWRRMEEDEVDSLISKLEKVIYDAS